MSKPYREDDFARQITQDRSWRLKEISDLKTAILRADPGLQKVLLRGLVTICYAHWGGSVRFAARKFLEHVSLRKYRYRDIDRQFVRNLFLPRLATMTSAGSNIAARCKLVDEILDSPDLRFGKVDDQIINTRSNLNSSVFKDICLVCGLPLSLLEEDSTFIDVLLLKRRNEIAHGEDTFVGLEPGTTDQQNYRNDERLWRRLGADRRSAALQGGLIARNHPDLRVAGLALATQRGQRMVLTIRRRSRLSVCHGRA